MAGLDPGIYSQIQPTAQPVNPLAQMAQIAQIQRYQQEGDKDRRALDLQTRRDAVLASPEFQTLDANGKAARLQGLGDFDNAGKVITSAAAANKDQRAADASGLDMAIKRNDALSGAMSHLAQNPADMDMVLGQMVQSQIITPDYAEKIKAGAGQAPNAAAFFNAGSQAAISAKDKLTAQIQQQGQQIQIRGQDLTAQTTMRGQNMTDERSREANTGAMSTKNRDAEMKLSDDYRAQSKDFKAVSDAYRTIETTLDKATTSPAATLAGATKFMKLLDPGSVVRESELGMALQASGVIDRATNYINILQSGKVLTPTQVKDFKSITGEIYNAAKQGQDAVDADYTAKAEQYGLNPKNIIQDLGPKKKGEAAPKAAAQRKTINGVTYENDGKGWYKAD